MRWRQAPATLSSAGQSSRRRTHGRPRNRSPPPSPASRPSDPPVPLLPPRLPLVRGDEDGDPPGGGEHTASTRRNRHQRRSGPRSSLRDRDSSSRDGWDEGREIPNLGVGL